MTYLKKLYITTIILLLSVINAWAQPKAESIKQDSLRLVQTLYYERDSVYATMDQLDKLHDFIWELREDSTKQVVIYAYTSRYGTAEGNMLVSQARAKALAELFRSCKVRPSQITFQGFGVDSIARTYAEARRADIYEVIMINGNNADNDQLLMLNQDTASETGVTEHSSNNIKQAEVKEEIVINTDSTTTAIVKDSIVAEPIEQAKIVELPIEVKDSIKIAEVVEQPKESIIVADIEQPKKETKQVELVEQSKVVEKPIEEPQKPTRNSKIIIHNPYFGIGIGSSSAWSTFTGTGVNTQLLAGVEFTKLISAELSLGYSNISTKTTQCCENLYYANGKRYFAPIAGVSNYRYGDLKSSVSLFNLTAKANFNLVSIWLKDSPWSGLVSPKIGYVQSWTNIQSVSKNVNKASSVHFSAGLDLSGGYQINDNWGLRLTTGFDYLTGNGIDAMPQTEHKTNILWNNTLSVICKF